MCRDDTGAIQPHVTDKRRRLGLRVAERRRQQFGSAHEPEARFREPQPDIHIHCNMNVLRQRAAGLPGRT